MTLYLFLLKSRFNQQRKRSFENSRGSRSHGVQQVLSRLICIFCYLSLQLLGCLSVLFICILLDSHTTQDSPLFISINYFFHFWRNTDLQAKWSVIQNNIFFNDIFFFYHSFIYPDDNRPAIG